MKLTEAQMAGNPLRVTRDGEPVEDQAKGLREFMDVARNGEEPDENERITVCIIGSLTHGARVRFAELIAAILADGQIQDVNSPTGTIYVNGYLDDSTMAFIGKLDALENELRMVNNAAHERQQRDELRIMEAEEAAKALESRLLDVACRRLALQVHHGDVPAEHFEHRRRIEVESVRQIAAQARMAFQRRFERRTMGETDA